MGELLRAIEMVLFVEFGHEGQNQKVIIISANLYNIPAYI